MARFVPSLSQAIKSKLSASVVYIYGSASFCALGYAGKAERSSFNFRFKSKEKRDGYVRDWLQAQDRYAAEKAARLAAKKAQGRVLAVGDVLRASWGYEQTNIDYYQVVELVGAKSVKVRPIAGDSSVEDEQHFNDRGKVVPVPDSFIGEAFVKRDDQGSISLNSYSSARKIDPIAVLPNGSKMYAASYWSSYA